MPMKLRHQTPGNLDLRARKDDLAHAHAPDRERRSGRHERRRPLLHPNYPIAAPPDVHRRGQVAHPGRNRSRRRYRKDRGHPAPRGSLLFQSDRMAPPAGRRSDRRPDPGQTRPENRRTQSAGRRPGPASARQCPPHAAPEARRSHHRPPKKVAELLGIPLAPNGDEP